MYAVAVAHTGRSSRLYACTSGSSLLYGDVFISYFQFKHCSFLYLKDKLHNGILMFVPMDQRAREPFQICHFALAFITHKDFLQQKVRGVDVTVGATWFDCQVISGRCKAETPQQWPLSSTDAAKMKRCGSCGLPLEAINGKWNEPVVKLTPIHTCVVEIYTSRLRERERVRERWQQQRNKNTKIQIHRQCPLPFAKL